MGTARRPPSFNRRPETVDHNRERERERYKYKCKLSEPRIIEVHLVSQYRSCKKRHFPLSPAPIVVYLSNLVYNMFTTDNVTGVIGCGVSHCLA